MQYTSNLKPKLEATFWFEHISILGPGLDSINTFQAQLDCSSTPETGISILLALSVLGSTAQTAQQVRNGQLIFEDALSH